MNAQGKSSPSDHTSRRERVKAKLAGIVDQCGLTPEELQRLQNATEIIVVDDKKPRHLPNRRVEPGRAMGEHKEEQ